MLVLTRKYGTTVAIGNEIKVTFIKGKGNQVKIAIDAPREVNIVREEISNIIDSRRTNYRHK